MKVDIRYIQGRHEFGRAILYADLFNTETNEVINIGTNSKPSLAQILQFVKHRQLEIVNSQEVLWKVILENGFAT